MQVHLALFPVVGRRQCHDPEHPRADPFGKRLDRAAFACPVTAFENDANLDALLFYPLLHLDQLDMQLTQLLEVNLVFQLPALFGIALGGVLFLFCHVQTSHT
ncbi:hypothetical protein D3C77_642830 [compost metagenome]